MTDNTLSSSADYPPLPSPVRRSWPSLLGWLAASFAAASVGALFMPGAWYAELNKPSWNPPGWLFGPVWTVLYSMMAVAAWLVWQFGGFRQQGRALGWYLVQLLLNALWSPLFFGLHSPALALGEILLLWVAIAITTRKFWRVSKWAAWLMVPYLGWVSFATVLNFILWRLNP